MGAFQFRMAMTWQRVEDPSGVKLWFLRDSPGFGIVPELTPRADEAIFDKITMSAFEGTPLAIALRDCGLIAFAIVGVAMEIGIESTVRQGAGSRPYSIDRLAFMGDAIQTDMKTFCGVLAQNVASFGNRTNSHVLTELQSDSPPSSLVRVEWPVRGP
jgi:biuret amidohydrolase